MSKNKNPLKDLDLFLKQQAASFVNPKPLSEKVQEQTPASAPTTPSATSSETDVIAWLNKLIDENPDHLYDLLIKAAEAKPSAERTVLINTALYMKNTTNWKEAIKEYWSKH